MLTAGEVGEIVLLSYGGVSSLSSILINLKKRRRRQLEAYGWFTGF